MKEKSTRYFLNLKKRNHVKKYIRKLCINGKITTDRHCILKEQERYYTEPYKSSINSSNIGEKISSFLNDLYTPQLSEEPKKSCKGLISPEECSELLDSFRSNTSPGNDGIPDEFYRKFWPLISESFFRSANGCFEKGEMSCSQKQAVVNLIEKSGKDRTLLENWGPISLVHIDTIIMSMVIAARVKRCYPVSFTATRLVMLKIVLSVKQYVLFSISLISQLRKTFQVFCCL